MALDLSALDDEPVKMAGNRTMTPLAAKAPLDAFEEDPGNPRFEFDDPEFDDFVEDVRARGILQPLIVVQLENGKLRIRFGARRYRAAVRIGLSEIPYTITEDERQLDDYAQVSENQRRKNLTPMELARFVQRRIAAGEKKKDIAAKLRLDPADITHLHALLDLPAFLLELYHSNKCRSAKFLYDLRNLHKQHANLVKRRCNGADEINRRLISGLAEEIQNPLPKQDGAVGGPSDTELPHDRHSETDFGGRAAAAKPESGDGKGGPPCTSVVDNKPRERDGEHAQQRASGDYAMEWEARSSSEDSKIRTPMLRGRYNNHDVIIVLTQRPSSSGGVVVLYRDGSGQEEVRITEVILTELTEAVA
jgi:ParB family chromosome partitioning protein